MRPVRLLDLGTVPPVRSQSVYHAVAQGMTAETPDTVILVSPSDPYVCIGFHQDLEKEVDLEYCRLNGLPVYRREVGGGAVYLDGGQVFVQWVFHPGRLPVDLNQRFEFYVRPLVATYRALGIEAYHRPINDIHVGGKKIGGTGAAQMGDAEVVVGSLMFTFDWRTMARVLKVSSEKMRDKIFESLEQYMTTMENQIGSLPGRDTVKALYREQCAMALGAELVPGEWTEEENARAAEWDMRLGSEQWLRQRGGLRKSGIKIHEDVRVVEGAYKAPGGLVRVTARLSAGMIDDITFSGDFTLFPSDALSGLERALLGLRAEADVILPAIDGAYHAFAIRSPGVSPQDFASAITAANLS